jgi:hypothetical protein
VPGSSARLANAPGRSPIGTPCERQVKVSTCAPLVPITTMPVCSTATSNRPGAVGDANGE